MKNPKKNKVVWFTGLSGVGKTTLAKLFIKKLKKKEAKILTIDGDIFRKKMNLKNSFTKKNIFFNNQKIISYVRKNYRKYDYTIISVISPLRKTRFKAFKMFKENYFEIYLHCPLRVLVRRDTKGLYKKAKQKKIINLIGFNSKIKYEKSLHKTIKINTDLLTKKKALDKISKKINY